MKKNIDNDELIITNNIDDNTIQVVAAAENDNNDAGEGGKKATKKDITDNEKVAKTDFRTLVRENITEEDEPLSPRLTLMKALGVDFISAQLLRRNIWLILLIAVFAVIYISNRYSCQNSMVEIDKLTKELKDAKFKALSTSSELTEKSRESTVLRQLKECGDSTINIPDVPPYLINVPEK